MGYYVNHFTETAKKMGRNYVANIAIEYVKNLMDEDISLNGVVTLRVKEQIDVIHKAYAQVFVDDSLPWSTAEIYKPEPVEATPFDIENDPF